MTDVFEGSIIRCIRRLEEILRQMCQASKAIGNIELENKFAEGNIIVVIVIVGDYPDLFVYNHSLYVTRFAKRDHFCQNICDLICEKPLLKHIKKQFCIHIE